MTVLDSSWFILIHPDSVFSEVPPPNLISALLPWLDTLQHFPCVSQVAGRLEHSSRDQALIFARCEPGKSLCLSWIHATKLMKYAHCATRIGLRFVDDLHPWAGNYTYQDVPGRTRTYHCVIELTNVDTWSWWFWMGGSVHCQSSKVQTWDSAAANRPRAHLHSPCHHDDFTRFPTECHGAWPRGITVTLLTASWCGSKEPTMAWPASW